MKKRGWSLLLAVVLLLPQAGAAQEEMQPPYASVTVTCDQSVVRPGEPVTVSAQVDTNAEGEIGFGAWFQDGRRVEGYSNPDFVLADGKVSQLTVVLPYTDDLPWGTLLQFEVWYADGQVAKDELYLPLEKTPDEYYLEANAQRVFELVQPVNIDAEVVRSTGAYADMYLSRRVKTLPAGTKAYYINYYGTKAAKLWFPDGTSYWVPYANVSISKKDYTLYEDYSLKDKDVFVNAKGYESKTEYLIWLSLKTQKVNIFKGQKNDWHIERVYACATGKNTTPTIAGVFQTQYRTPLWDFNQYIVNQVTVFNGGHAFHTRTYTKATGNLLDATIGRPVSAGCVRMYDQDVNWIYRNIPLGTTVVVF